LLLALLLTGCAVGPDYQTPAGPAQSRYDLAQVPTQERVERTGPALRDGSPVPANWWTLLRCPALNDIEATALISNKTLVAAQATLRQAVQIEQEARAAYWPQLGVSASAARNGSGIGSTANSIDGVFLPSGQVANYFTVGPAASYMIDLFGATARAVEQSAAEQDYQHAQLLAAHLAVTGGVATQAINMAAARLQIGSVEDILTNDRENLKIAERLYTIGKAARGDVLTAQSQLVGDQPQLASLRQQLSVARHTLSVLLSLAPSEWTPPDFAIDDFTVPQDLPTTLPSALVHRRPDILAAESLLHADSAAVGIAVAQLYPTVTLSASLTQGSADISQLFKGANSVWSLGGGLTAPIFRGGALQAQKQAAIEAYQAQRATYEQTVIAAFGQVADSLRALNHDAELLHDTEAGLTVATASLEVQRASYKVGKTSLVQLLIAQRTYAQARQGLTTARAQQLEDIVQFFLAMGGGLSMDVVADKANDRTE
jgi:NodT family efflux transporter outer membrane factor (OMF) lipoprotein